jgi:hypothetical protein
MFNFIFSLFLPRLAYACASCGFNDKSNTSYLIMIIFMTLLPVILVGSVVYYLRKHRGQNDLNEK